MVANRQTPDDASPRVAPPPVGRRLGRPRPPKGHWATLFAQQTRLITNGEGLFELSGVGESEVNACAGQYSWAATMDRLGRSRTGTRESRILNRKRLRLDQWGSHRAVRGPSHACRLPHARCRAHLLPRIAPRHPRLPIPNGVAVLLVRVVVHMLLLYCGRWTKSRHRVAASPAQERDAMNRTCCSRARESTRSPGFAFESRVITLRQCRGSNTLGVCPS